MGNYFAGFAAFFSVAGLIIAAFVIMTVFACWKLFEKAGEPAWAALVPYYSTYKMSEIGTGNATAGWASIALSAMRILVNLFIGSNSELAFVILIAKLIVDCYIYYMFTESFGQSTLMCVLSILFSGIIFLIMALSSSTEYVGPNGVPRFRRPSTYSGSEYTSTYDYSSYHNNNKDGFLK